MFVEHVRVVLEEFVLKEAQSVQEDPLQFLLVSI